MDETVEKIGKALAENMKAYPDSRFVSDDDVAMAYLLYKVEDGEKRHAALIERMEKLVVEWPEDLEDQIRQIIKEAKEG